MGCSSPRRNIFDLIAVHLIPGKFYFIKPIYFCLIIFHDLIFVFRRRQFRGIETTRVSGDIITSESENPSDDFDLINKSCALKIKLDPMDFDYFTSVVRSDDDARLDSVLYEPRFRPKHSKKIMPMDLIDDKVSEVMKSRVSPYEFSMLVIRLLTSLCKAEHGFAFSTGKMGKEMTSRSTKN